MTIIILGIIGAYVIFTVGWMVYFGWYFDRRSKQGIHDGSGAIGVIILPLAPPIVAVCWLMDKFNEIWKRD